MAAIGEQAPDFDTVDHEDKPVHLRDFRGKQAVVLYFYPRDETPGCTLQACNFRDTYQDFADAGAAVIGISADPPDRHRAFATGHRLPFSLLSDTTGKLRQSYGVPKTLGFFAGRVTYVIDKAGTVRHVFDSQFLVGRHIKQALDQVRRLQQE
jgi:thioredoxin-dependent peroxiredoxin